MGIRNVEALFPYDVKEETSPPAPVQSTGITETISEPL